MNLYIVTVTGEVLKCIVIVDNLHRIEIETTTRLLYLEDSPEEMMVRGYDLEGVYACCSPTVCGLKSYVCSFLPLHHFCGHF